MKRRRRSGYVLLLVIVMIAIAGLLLAAVARQSLLLAIQGVEARESLQRRWGATTCQRVFLERAEDILKQLVDDPSQDADPQKPPPDHATAKIVLGGMVFDLLLADENAKVNLNAIYRLRNVDEVRRIVRESANAGERLEVRLLPLRVKSTQADQPVFESWGQVFAVNRMAQDRPVPEQLMAATTQTTCWGDGRLNVLRASDWRIERLCRMVVAPAAIDRLLEWRRQYFAQQQEKRRQAAASQQSSDAQTNAATRPASTQDAGQDYAAALGQLQLRQGEQQQIGELLTSRSTCHSLWVTITQGKRSWSSYMVLHAPDNEKPVYTREVWQ
jgi:type II secretory pathway pseudopilin PulG